MEKTGARHWHCRQCDIETSVRRRIKHKTILVAEAGGKCIHCGYDQCQGAFHFHHRNPSTKSFTVSSSLNMSLRKLRVEAAKCDLVCNNCHTEIEQVIRLARTIARNNKALVEKRGKLYSDCPHHGKCEFVKRDKIYLRCKKCRNEAVGRTLRKNKSQLIAESGGKCSMCGYKKCQAALHFHHRNPKTKSFSLANGGGISLDRLRAEAKKCALVCGNCHDEIHDKDFNIPEHQQQPKHNKNSLQTPH
jgi:hypothetical protein